MSEVSFEVQVWNLYAERFRTLHVSSSEMEAFEKKDNFLEKFKDMTPAPIARVRRSEVLENPSKGIDRAKPIEPTAEDYEYARNLKNMHLLDRGGIEACYRKLTAFYRALERSWRESIHSEMSAYEQGFNACRELALNIVDEHEGYLSRIEALAPVKKSSS